MRSQKPVIAIDLDNTMVDLKVVEDVSFEMGLIPPLKTSDVKSWGYEEFPESVRRNIFDKFANRDYMCTLKPFPWTIDKLNYLSEFYSVWCVTKRVEELRHDTIKFVENLFPQITNTYFVRDNQSKIRALQDIRAIIYVDDNPMDMLLASDFGVKCYLICNEDTKYNHEFKNFHTITTIENLGDLNI